MDKQKKGSGRNFLSTIWHKRKKTTVSTSSSTTSLPTPEASSAAPNSSIWNKKKKTALSTSSSTSLPMAEAPSATLISWIRNKNKKPHLVFLQRQRHYPRQRFPRRCPSRRYGTRRKKLQL